MRTYCYRTAIIALTFLALASVSALQAQDSVSVERIVPELKAKRINPHPPSIDGILDDEIWKSDGIELARNFTQREPDDGTPATESTLVAVRYDDEALYVAYWCYDSEPEKIDRQLVRRDRYSQSDAVSLRLDPYHDHQTGYYFYVSAAGVMRDQRVYNDDHMDISWNAVWESGVKMHPWGWTAEMKIPYHCIRFAEKEQHTWGVDFSRFINRRDESAVWAHVPQEEGGFASKFGHLTGLHGISPASHLEILPYAVSNVETMPKSFGNDDGRDFMGNVGVDFKYGLSSNLILDATINPDFGQVELDAPVLNLSTYETFFPERRPFFLEGSHLYRSEYTMFYSRRIGRRPSGGVDDDDLLTYTNFPKATTILGAAKLTGRLSSGTSLAFLTALTDEETADYAAHTNVVRDTADEIISADTVYRTGVVEPMASYSVLRVKQDLFNNSNIGGILTVASQDTRTPSTTGGIDWRLFTNNGMWMSRGQGIFSRNGSDNVGYALDLVLEKATGKHVRGAVGCVIKDPDLYINRLGYTSRSDVQNGWTWWQYRTTDDWWIVRNSWNNINLSSDWNYAGDHISGHMNFNNSIQFVNNWYGGMGVGGNFGKYDDRETRGQGLWEEPKAWNAWVWLDTDERRKFSVEADFNFGDSRTSPWWGSELLFRYRPASNVEFSIQGEYVHDFDQLYWVDNVENAQIADTIGDGSYEVIEGDHINNDLVLFAEKNQDIFTLSFSAGVVLNRNLSCQFSAEGLISGLDYHHHMGLVGTGDYTNYAINRSAAYDYNYSALYSTLLIRWEYLPGSTLYLVWSRSRDEVDDTVNDLDLSRDMKRFFSAGSENVFLIKASYWMSI